MVRKFSGGYIWIAFSGQGSAGGARRETCAIVAMRLSERYCFKDGKYRSTALSECRFIMRHYRFSKKGREDIMANEVTQMQVDDYIEGAMQFPVRNEVHLASMVILHFGISEDKAIALVKDYLKRHDVKFWNPKRWT